MIDPEYMRAAFRSSAWRESFDVLQTALGLIEEGFVPHVVSDAVCSRTKENWDTGLGMMRDAGAVVTCTESVLFQLLKAAGTEEFKAVSRMIK